MSPLGVGDGLAVLARQYVGQFVIVAGDQFEEFHQDANAALRVGGGPFRLRRLGILDRRAQFRLRGQRHRAAHGAVHRLHDVLLAAAGAGDTLAADEMTVFDHDISPLFVMDALSAFARAKATRGRTQPLCSK
ncbi:hypothetical protein ACVINZ_003539 [Mesorhizobium jarvisii]